MALLDVEPAQTFSSDKPAKDLGQIVMLVRTDGLPTLATLRPPRPDLTSGILYKERPQMGGLACVGFLGAPPRMGQQHDHRLGYAALEMTA